jgi:hypothetical protein
MQGRAEQEVRQVRAGRQSVSQAVRVGQSRSVAGQGRHEVRRAGKANREEQACR